MSYESLHHISKIEEIESVIDMFMTINRMRTQGLSVRGYPEIPAILTDLKAQLGLKESEFKLLVQEVSSLLEEFSKRVKGESGDLIEEVPSEVRAVVKKVLSRLVKAGIFSIEYGVKSYDWWIEKEISSSNGRQNNDNMIVFNIESHTKDASDRVEMRIDQSTFNRLHDSISKLRETALTLLN